MNSRILEAEKTLAQHVAGFAPTNWVRFVANIELDEDCCDSICLFIVQEGSELTQINTGDPTYGRQYFGLLKPLREVWESYKRSWKVADLIVDFNGSYSIRYGYEYRRLAQPMDLTGVSVLRDYIVRFGSEIPRR